MSVKTMSICLVCAGFFLASCSNTSGKKQNLILKRQH